MFSKTARTCLLANGFSLAAAAPAVAQKPKIAVFSGPTATIRNSKALVLMACLMKFGSLPVPSDPEHPTERELGAIRTTVTLYQAVFDSH